MKMSYDERYRYYKGTVLHPETDVVNVTRDSVTYGALCGRTDTLERRITKPTSSQLFRFQQTAWRANSEEHTAEHTALSTDNTDNTTDSIEDWLDENTHYRAANNHNNKASRSRADSQANYNNKTSSVGINNNHNNRSVHCNNKCLQRQATNVNDNNSGEVAADFPASFTCRQQAENAVFISIIVLLLITLILLISTGLTPLSKEAFYDKYHQKLDPTVPVKEQVQRKELEKKAAAEEKLSSIPPTSRYIHKLAYGAPLNIPCYDDTGTRITSNIKWVRSNAKQRTQAAVTAPAARHSAVHVCQDEAGGLHEQVLLVYKQSDITWTHYKVYITKELCSGKVERVFHSWCHNTLCNGNVRNCPWQVSEQCLQLLAPDWQAYNISRSETHRKLLVAFTYSVPAYRDTDLAVCDEACLLTERLDKSGLKERMVEAVEKLDASFKTADALLVEKLRPVSGTVYKDKMSYSCRDEGYYLPNKSVCWPCWPDSVVQRKDADEVTPKECTLCGEESHQPDFGQSACVDCAATYQLNYRYGEESCYKAKKQHFVPSSENLRVDLKRLLEETLLKKEVDPEMEKELAFAHPNNSIQLIEKDIERVELKLEELPESNRIIGVVICCLLLLLTVLLFGCIHWRRLKDFDQKLLPAKRKLAEKAAMVQSTKLTAAAADRMANDGDSATDVANLRDFEDENEMKHYQVYPGNVNANATSFLFAPFSGRSLMSLTEPNNSRYMHYPTVNPARVYPHKPPPLAPRPAISRGLGTSSFCMNKPAQPVSRLIPAHHKHDEPLRTHLQNKPSVTCSLGDMSSIYRRTKAKSRSRAHSRSLTPARDPLQCILEAKSKTTKSHSRDTSSSPSHSTASTAHPRTPPSTKPSLSVNTAHPRTPPSTKPSLSVNTAHPRTKPESPLSVENMSQNHNMGAASASSVESAGDVEQSPCVLRRSEHSTNLMQPPVQPHVSASPSPARLTHSQTHAKEVRSKSSVHGPRRPPHRKQLLRRLHDTSASPVCRSRNKTHGEICNLPTHRPAYLHHHATPDQRQSRRVVSNPGHDENTPDKRQSNGGNNLQTTQ